MGDTRVERFEPLRDLIKIRNTLVYWNPPSSRTQRRTSHKPGVLQYLLFEFPAASVSYQRTRTTHATFRPKYVRSAPREVVTRRTSDRMSAQHVERRFTRTFHLTHFAHSIAGHAQRLELLGTFDFPPRLNPAALLLPQRLPPFRRGCGDFRIGNQRTCRHFPVKFCNPHVGHDLIRFVIPRPQGLLLFPEFLPDTSRDLFKLLGAEVSQKRFRDLLRETSGTVVPYRSFLTYLR